MTLEAAFESTHLSGLSHGHLDRAPCIEHCNIGTLPLTSPLCRVLVGLWSQVERPMAGLSALHGSVLLVNESCWEGKVLIVLRLEGVNNAPQPSTLRHFYSQLPIYLPPSPLPLPPRLSEDTDRPSPISLSALRI